MKALLALSMLVAAVASASDVVVGGTAISIAAPPGYVEVTPAMPDLWALAQAATAPGYRAVAVFVDEHAGHGASFERGMNVQVLSKFEGHQWTATEFAKLKKWVVDGNNTAAVDSARAAAIEKVNGNLAALTGEHWDPKVQKVLALPPHLDTGEQLAYSEITTIDGAAPDGTDAKEQVTTISVTLIKRKLLYLYVSGGASDLTWTRDVAQKWVATMTAANALTASKAPAMAVDGAAPPIQEQEREGIVAMVVLADAITEICTRDHPPMAADLAETLTAWQERNQRYVGYAQADPRYAELRKKLVTQKIKKPDGRMPQSQCDEALRRLRTPDEDVDALRMRHAKKP